MLLCRSSRVRRSYLRTFFYFWPKIVQLFKVLQQQQQQHQLLVIGECIDYTIASNFSPLSYSSSLLMSTIFHLFSYYSWIDGALATLSPSKYCYFDPKKETLLFARATYKKGAKVRFLSKAEFQL